MLSIQDKYRHFRRWQENPFDYRDTHDHHECCNCGGQSNNNYCPRCGQKAVYGPITWHSVWQGVMDVWGVGTRSLPYSLWQLIWRPGYLMRDYISGKRQVSFPPVKMLVVVAVLVFAVNQLFHVVYGGDDDSATTDSVNVFLTRYFYDWMAAHIEWATLFAFSMFIVPVWFVFRYAPRLPRHTLPQGFFIQVFIGVQFLLFYVIVILLTVTEADGDLAGAIMVFLVLPLMLVIDYKQLFGYGWWATIWRILASFLAAMLCFKILIQTGVTAYLCTIDEWARAGKSLVVVLDRLALLWLLFEVTNVFNTKPWRDHSWGRVMWRIVIAMVVFFMTTMLCGWLGIENALANLLNSFTNHNSA